jgi:hypothetical protein
MMTYRMKVQQQQSQRHPSTVLHDYMVNRLNVSMIPIARQLTDVSMRMLSALGCGAKYQYLVL